MVPEAPLEETAAGLAAAGAGWFVVNARDARWVQREGRGEILPFTGLSDEEAEAYFPQVGVNLFVLPPGEPMSMYHGEESQEDFLVLDGKCLLIIEGEERPLRQWDFVHCPPWTEHTLVGAGETPCVVLAVGSRGGEAIRYPLSDVARKYGAGSDVETDSPPVAYARFSRGEEVRYSPGRLPG